MDQNFTSLVNEFGPAVYRQALGILGNRADAEEAVQDIFMIVHKKLDSFRGESALSTWIYTITFRACLRRRAGPKKWFVSLDDEEADRAVALPHPDPDPEALSITHETNVMLSGCIALLPPHEAAAITLYYMEEKNYDEIGTILAMPPGTVATTLHRARRHLHTLITDADKD